MVSSAVMVPEQSWAMAMPAAASVIREANASLRRVPLTMASPPGEAAGWFGTKPLPYRALPLHGPRGEPGDVVLHEEGVDHRHGHRTQQRAGHELAPIEGVASDQLAHHADRHGAHARLLEEEQGVEELILREREGEDAGGEEAGEAEGQDDPRHGA